MCGFIGTAAPAEWRKYELLEKCPLLAAVIVSGLVIEGAGVANGVKSGEIENPAELEAACIGVCFYRFKTGRLSVE